MSPYWKQTLSFQPGKLQWQAKISIQVSTLLELLNSRIKLGLIDVNVRSVSKEN